MIADIRFTVQELEWIKSIFGCSKGHKSILKNRLVSSTHCIHLQPLVDAGVLDLNNSSVYGRGTYLYTINKEWISVFMQLFDLKFSTKFK